MSTRQLSVSASGEPLRNRLGDDDLPWVRLQPWLKERGYALPPRYQPNWKPTTTNGRGLDALMGMEDGQPARGPVMNATRISDGAYVMLKLVDPSIHTEEADIAGFFSSDALASNPRNHCVPVHEMICAPGEREGLVLVMPLLVLWDQVPFDTFGETIDFFRQIFQGVQFMHAHRVAHRDISILNILMDGRSMFPKPWSPYNPWLTRDMKERTEPFTRTERPPKYYLADFGISRRYDASIAHPLAEPWWAGDKTVPEFQFAGSEPRNPFPTDVYYLGNLIRTHFMGATWIPHPDYPGTRIEKMLPLTSYAGFGFMLPLVNDMVQDDPIQRPNMDQVMERFERIVSNLSSWKLRSRAVITRKAYYTSQLYSRYGWFAHWFRRICFIWNRIPAIPCFRG